MTLIRKYVPLSGYSHVFPLGSEVLVSRREKDKKDKEFYHAIFVSKDNISIDLSFNVENLECTEAKLGIKLSAKPECYV